MAATTTRDPRRLIVPNRAPEWVKSVVRGVRYTAPLAGAAAVLLRLASRLFAAGAGAMEEYAEATGADLDGDAPAE